MSSNAAVAFIRPLFYHPTFTVLPTLSPFLRWLSWEATGAVVYGGVPGESKSQEFVGLSLPPSPPVASKLPAMQIEVRLERSLVSE